jgi:hypothetical protein
VWNTANQVTLTWDAVPKVAATDQANKYQVYTKAGSPTATPQKVGSEITATQQAVTFTVEGRYYLCVGSIRYPQGETVGIPSSRLACSDIAADTQSGAFGVVYYVAPAPPGGLRLGQ